MSQPLGPAPLIHPGAIVRASTLGRYTEVGEDARVVETVLGDYSYLERGTDVIYATIGKFCSVASLVRINPGNHPMERASQSHFTYRSSRYFPGQADDDAAFFDWRRSHAVTVGHDVWIGHAAVILPGRVVGTGAVVAAGAIVTRDVAPYTIVAGNPARVIRRRFTELVAEGLEALAWWDWTHERLRETLTDLRTLTAEAFLERHR